MAAIVEETMGKMAIRGLIPRKVDIDVEELVQWCRSQNRAVDAKARSAFTAAQLQALNK